MRKSYLCQVHNKPKCRQMETYTGYTRTGVCSERSTTVLSRYSWILKTLTYEIPECVVPC